MYFREVLSIFFSIIAKATMKLSKNASLATMRL